MLNKLKKKNLSNERGAISIEFLGVLPFYFFFFLILWQAVSTGYVIMTAKTAVNEAAKYYAMTEDAVEAKLMISNVLATTSLIEESNISVGPHPEKAEMFVVSVSATQPLVFVPDLWKEKASLPIEVKTVGRQFQ